MSATMYLRKWAYCNLVGRRIPFRTDTLLVARPLCLIVNGYFVYDRTVVMIYHVYYYSAKHSSSSIRRRTITVLDLEILKVPNILPSTIEVGSPGICRMGRIILQFENTSCLFAAST